MVETMDAHEVAELFQVTTPTVYRWAREGILPARRIGRILRFNKADVEAMLGERGPQAPAPEKPETKPTGDGAVHNFISFLAEAVVRELREKGQL